MELRMSQKERDRLKVMAQVKAKKMAQQEAAAILRLSERQVRRLLRRYERHGDAGLVHQLRGRRSNRRTEPAVQDQAVALINTHYRDYGPTLASEVLATEHGIVVSRETLRHWMIAADLWQSRQAKVHHRQWRERKACFGELAQMDTSLHDWFEGRGESAVLIAIIDDATSRVFLRFYDTDSTRTNMSHLRDYIRRYGRPLAVYADRASHFTTTRQPTIDEELAGQKAHTQIERALGELGMEYIAARSPQAKGRVERLFKTLQDRLVKALRRKGIAMIEQANRYLDQEFMPYWRQHFAVTPASAADAHRSRKGFDLDAIFSVQHKRTVMDDYTFQYANDRYQIGKKSIQAGLRRSKIILEDRLDQTQRIRWRKQYLRYTKIEPEKLKKPARPVEATPVGLRPPSVAPTGKKQKPAPNHPWKRSWKPDSSTLHDTGHF
jgi:transposase